METQVHCGMCHCYLDSDELFCPNCGTENPQVDENATSGKDAISVYSFACASCGASMSYDASARTLRCPFCGSTKLQPQTNARTVEPSGCLPFSFDRQTAIECLRAWLNQGFWRPSDAARASTIGEMTAVYVPYWVFSAETKTNWTADSSATPFGARGDWVPVGGWREARWESILVGGSSTLTPHETQAIAPFDLSRLQPPEQFDLTNSIVEEFRVSRKSARPSARALIEQQELAACSQLVAGSVRNVRVNVQLSSLEVSPVLLPVWILAYQYKNRTYRVLINGQTRAIAGDAPFSHTKLAVIVIVVVVLIAIGLLLLANR